MTASQPDVFLLDDGLWIASQPTGVQVYDFDFRTQFPCRTPWKRPDEVQVVCRMGAFEDYAKTFVQFRGNGLRMIHSPDEHLRASQLSKWYPLLEGMTPLSRWYDELPDVSQIERDFRWPVFVKGIRQTNRHQRGLSIVHSAAQFQEVLKAYRDDPILRWQQMVVREYCELRFVEDPMPERIPSSFEFRTFWWQGRFVGGGRYWWEGKKYDWNDAEKRAGIGIAEKAAELKLEPKELADKMSGQFSDLAKTLNISNTRFIRTTDPGHEQRHPQAGHGAAAGRHRALRRAARELRARRAHRGGAGRPRLPRP